MKINEECYIGNTGKKLESLIINTLEGNATTNANGLFNLPLRKQEYDVLSSIVLSTTDEVSYKAILYVRGNSDYLRLIVTDLNGNPLANTNVTYRVRYISI